MKIEIGKKYRDEMGRVGFSLTGDGEALGISGRVFMLVEEVAE